LDQTLAANRKAMAQTVKSLHRDVYICEWLGQEGGKPVQVNISSRQEFFPVFVAGGKPLSEDGESYLNIGILHVPTTNSAVTESAKPTRLVTLTLLPPDPHILLPLLIRAVDVENRFLSKMQSKVNDAVSVRAPISKTLVPMDEQWRSEFKGYMFRVPPYYQHALRRCLRTILPSSVHSLLNADSVESITLQCFSTVCLQKIRNGEQIARDYNERLERQEENLRKRGAIQLDFGHRNERLVIPRYGNYDSRTSIESYLSALRNMPAPWKVKTGGLNVHGSKSEKLTCVLSQEIVVGKDEPQKTAIDALGDLPVTCLMAYYESRRKWLFGGTGLSTRGVHVEGVNNGGSNSQRCHSIPSKEEPFLLALAGVGVSMLNQTTTTKMGDYRERLLFSKPPVVGYGSNDFAGVAATTATDGSPMWSVDNDAMPMPFFDEKTGEFIDSVQARMRTRLMVNFGNPYKEKRADSLIPEKYQSQSPSIKQRIEGGPNGRIPRVAPGSAPPESFNSVEEGEAVFVLKSPSRQSLKREQPGEPKSGSVVKRSRSEFGNTVKSVAVRTKASKKMTPMPPDLSFSKKPAGGKYPPPPPSSPLCHLPTPPPPNANASVYELLRGKGAVHPPPPPPYSDIRPMGKQSTGALSVRVSIGVPPKPPSVKSTPIINPTKTPSDVTDLQAKATVATTVDLANLQRPDEKPKVQLPSGWMCVWSNSQNRWYFFNTKNNRSVWEWPPPVA
jgi:hypothetical protein